MTRASVPRPRRPRCGALDLVADAHAARAQDAAVVVDRRTAAWLASMPTLRVDHRQLDVVHAQIDRRRPAVRSGRSRRTPQQMWFRSAKSSSTIIAPVLGRARSVSVLISMPSARRRARGRELGRAGDLDEAEAARPTAREPVELAERRDLDAVLAARPRGSSARRRPRRGGRRSCRVETGSCRHLLRSELQMPAGHARSTTFAHVLVAEVPQRAHAPGSERAWPSPHRLVALDHRRQSSSSCSRSRERRLAHGDRVEQVGASASVPTRHGTHLPHDSSRQKPMKNLATSTMQRRVVHHDHAARAHDRADPRQRLVVDRHVEELGRDAAARRPPVCTALNARPSVMPPPISSTISRSVIPIGTSIRPVFGPCRRGRRPSCPCSSRCRSRRTTSAPCG